MTSKGGECLGLTKMKRNGIMGIRAILKRQDRISENARCSLYLRITGTQSSGYVMSESN